MQVHNGRIIKNSKKGDVYKELLSTKEEYIQLLNIIYKQILKGKLNPRILAECYCEDLIYKLEKIKVGSSGYNTTTIYELKFMIENAKEKIANIKEILNKNNFHLDKKRYLS